MVVDFEMEGQQHRTPQKPGHETLLSWWVEKLAHHYVDVLQLIGIRSGDTQ